ncbi:hypothetical protein [Polaromonas sp.]|uniref:hypothetical protein n=1 Tax=Polaromonas sp. TaxID=1869339 RepID=UPI003264A742
MPDPLVIDCSSACTVTVVHELSLPPLQLDLEQGGAIAAAVIGVWVLGWGIRMLIRSMNGSVTAGQEDSLG